MSDKYEILEKRVEDIEIEMDKLEARAESLGYPELGMTTRRDRCIDDAHHSLETQWLALWKQKVQLDAKLLNSMKLDRIRQIVRHSG